jgi:hypothetical protein
MLGQSRFLIGLMGETPAVIKAQVDLWDQSTVAQAAWGQATSKSSIVRQADAAFRERIADPIGQRVQGKLKDFMPETFGNNSGEADEDTHPSDYHIMKFCRLASHARISISSPTELIQLHDIGLEIERDAIKSLRETDKRSLAARFRGQPNKGFEGTSIDDLVRYVVQKTFQALDDEFQKKPAEEKEKIAQTIADSLRDLPPEEQDRIRQSAGLHDLTAETLRQTGALATLGFGVSSLVGIVGFSAYTTLTSLIAAVTGLVGITLPFSAYTTAASTLAMIANPLVFVPAVVGLGSVLMSKANRSIRGTLYPVFIASAVIAESASSESHAALDTFEERISDLVQKINTGNGATLLSLVKRFPNLGAPRLSTRIASYVAT